MCLAQTDLNNHLDVWSLSWHLWSLCIRFCRRFPTLSLIVNVNFTTHKVIVQQCIKDGREVLIINRSEKRHPPLPETFDILPRKLTAVPWDMMVGSDEISFQNGPFFRWHVARGRGEISLWITCDHNFLGSLATSSKWRLRVWPMVFTLPFFLGVWEAKKKALPEN